jgi:hypothetical protein
MGNQVADVFSLFLGILEGLADFIITTGIIAGFPGIILIVLGIMALVQGVGTILLVVLAVMAIIVGLIMTLIGDARND